MSIYPAKTATSEETPGVHRSSQVKYQTKLDYTPTRSGKKCETVNNQVECESTLQPDSQMFLCQELIEELPDAAEVIMTQLFLKEVIKRWKGKGRAEAKSEIKQLHFRDAFNSKH